MPVGTSCDRRSIAAAVAAGSQSEVAAASSLRWGTMLRWSVGSTCPAALLRAIALRLELLTVLDLRRVDLPETLGGVSSSIVSVGGG